MARRADKKLASFDAVMIEIDVVGGLLVFAVTMLWWRNLPIGH
jgi:hypothetical protein